ncbi:23541_t:CDS:2, partial [Gigaspora margarita]
HNKLNIRNLKLKTTRQSQTPIRSTSQSQISSQTPVRSTSQPQTPVRSTSRSILQTKTTNNLLNQRNSEGQKNSEAQEHSKVQRNSSIQRNIDTQRNNNAQRNSETQRNQFSDEETDSETFNNQYHINSDDDHETIREKMNTIKYPPNEQLEIVSKMALELHNKGHLDTILKDLSWKNLWNNSIAPAEIAREYRSEIKIKVKKALTEVFGRDRFPPIEQARPSADQVNIWKQKNTIRSCFNDLENPKDLDEPSFTWRLAVLEQVFPDETTKNNIAFASVCIDVICDTNYSGYELQQIYVIQEMNHALKGMQSDELELEADIELEANEADIELEANETNIELEANDIDIEYKANASDL